MQCGVVVAGAYGCNGGQLEFVMAIDVVGSVVRGEHAFGQW